MRPADHHRLCAAAAAAGDEQCVTLAEGLYEFRDGHLLAGNETIYTVGVNIPDIVDAPALAREVSAQLGLDYEETYQKLLNPYGLVFVPLKRFVRSEELAPLKASYEQMRKDAAALFQPSPLSGLEFQPNLQRSYPENELASNIIGFYNRDQRGNFGVEEKYNDLLAGTPVEAWVPQDPNRAAEIPHAEHVPGPLRREEGRGRQDLRRPGAPRGRRAAGHGGSRGNRRRPHLQPAPAVLRSPRLTRKEHQ